MISFLDCPETLSFVCIVICRSILRLVLPKMAANTPKYEATGNTPPINIKSMLSPLLDVSMTKVFR